MKSAHPSSSPPLGATGTVSDIYLRGRVAIFADSPPPCEDTAGFQAPIRPHTSHQPGRKSPPKWLKAGRSDAVVVHWWEKGQHHGLIRHPSAFDLARKLQVAQGVEVAGDRPLSFGRRHVGDRWREQMDAPCRSRLVWGEGHGNFLATLRRCDAATSRCSVHAPLPRSPGLTRRHQPAAA